jgi:hypothetical protein
MYTLLVRLMFIAAVLQLGLYISDIVNCRSVVCVRQLEKASHKVLKVNWRPISLFPEEGRRFR